MNPLDTVSDWFLRRDVTRGGGPLVGKSFIGVHRLGFLRGYTVALGSVTLVYLALALLQGCAPPEDEAGTCGAVYVAFGPTGEYCNSGDLEMDEATCCPDGAYAAGHNATGELVCVEN